MNKLLLLSLLLLLVGCQPVGPTYIPPRTPVPGQFTSPGGTAIVASGLGGAWSDPHLQSLVERALTESPDLLAAEARLRKARANQGIQEAAGGPELGMATQVTRDRLSENSGLLSNLPAKNLNTEFTTYQVGFDASWEIDLFGHQKRLSEGAQARTEAAGERMRDTRLVLASEVARNYVEYRTGQQRLRLAQEGLKDLEEVVRLTKIRVTAGDAANQDLQMAVAGRDRAEAALAGLRMGIRQSVAALSVLTAEPFAELDALLGGTVPLMAVPEPPAAGLPSDLLRRRPDVRAAERELAAASADVGVAQAERYPRFSLVGAGGWTSISTGNLISAASSTWSAGPRLSLPLLNRGRLKNQVKAQEASFDVASAAYRKSVLNAVADVEVALDRIVRSEDRRRRLLDAGEQYRDHAYLSDLQTKAGEISGISLLEARLALVSQEDLEVQAHGQSLTALISLQKALGGGW